MNEEGIYVDVGHLDFWWGIYGFSSETGWEDVLIYPDRGSDTEHLACFCLCTRAYLKNCIEDADESPEEHNFEAKVRRFLEGNELQYHFVYDDPEDGDFWEVPHDAPRNDHHVKPSYIELWYPAEGISLPVLRHSVEVFCKQFLNRDDIEVHLKEMMPFEEAVQSFEEHSDIKGVAVTEEVIEEMAREMSKTPEEMLKIVSSSAVAPWR